MEKVLFLVNSLIKSKIIKDPKYYFYIIIILSILYIPNYIGDYMNKVVKEIVKTELGSGMDQREKEKLEKHAELVNASLTLPPKIDNELRKLQQILKADRTFFCEYGNSLTSLSGNPFTYFTMRNEQNASGVKGIRQQYQQQSTDNFRFNVELKENKLYSLSDVETIKESDPIFYTILKQNGTKQVYLYLIELDGTPRGFVGVNYSIESPFSRDKVFYYMTNCAKSITDLAIVKEK